MTRILQIIVILIALAALGVCGYMFLPKHPPQVSSVVVTPPAATNEPAKPEPLKSTAPSPFSDTKPTLGAPVDMVDRGEITDQWIGESQGEIIGVEQPLLAAPEEKPEIPKPYQRPHKKSPHSEYVEPATVAVAPAPQPSYERPVRRAAEPKSNWQHVGDINQSTSTGSPSATGDGSSSFNIGVTPDASTPAQRLLHSWGELTRDHLTSYAPMAPSGLTAPATPASSVLVFSAESNKPSCVYTPAGSTPQQLVSQLRASGKIAVVNINLHSYALAPTHLASIQWPLKNNFGPVDIGYESIGWQLTTAPAASVCVVDAAIDFDDPRLAHAAAINKAERPNNAIDDDGNGLTDDIRGYNFRNDSPRLCDDIANFNHGSFVTSIIAAKPIGNTMDVIGLAPQCKIISAESLESASSYDPWQATGQLQSVIAGLNYAISRGAKVVNLSLGARVSREQLSELEKLPIWDDLQRADILVVCAAGNDYVNIDEQPVFPACINRPNIITVMACGLTGEVAEAPTSKTFTYTHFEPFSNYGTRSVDIAAPGSFVLGITTRNEAALMSGTSFAAAYVTAAAALVRGKYPDMTASQTKRHIISRAKSLPTLQNYCRSGRVLQIKNLLSK